MSESLPPDLLLGGPDRSRDTLWLRLAPPGEYTKSVLSERVWWLVLERSPDQGQRPCQGLLLAGMIAGIGSCLSGFRFEDFLQTLVQSA